MNKAPTEQKKKVVVIGGGNGAAKTLRALKRFEDEFTLSAVMAMSDSGGSSGRLREEFGILPPGDIMRAVLSLSRLVEYKELRTIFNKRRFTNLDKLDGHNLGNLILTLFAQYTGDFMSGVRALEHAVDAAGTVHPVSVEVSDLCAELKNGETVVGEHSIDRPEIRDDDHRIVRVWLDPLPTVYEPAAQAILEADIIVIGPGSLYCSLIPPLITDGMPVLLEQSKAKFIYVAGDGYEEVGEVGPTKLSEFISELEGYLPRALDAVLVSNSTLSERQLEIYEEKGWLQMDDDIEGDEHGKIVREHLQRRTTFGLGSPYIGKALREIIKRIV